MPAPNRLKMGYAHRTGGFCEGSDARFSDELCTGEWFYTLKEAIILNEKRRIHDFAARPQSTLCDRSAAPKSIIQMDLTPTRE